MCKEHPGAVHGPRRREAQSLEAQEEADTLFIFVFLVHRHYQHLLVIHFCPESSLGWTETQYS